jgi:glucuronoarabinoxylan endo-1,4-beta-xylanase
MNVVKKVLVAVYTLLIISLFSCGGSSNNPTPKPPGSTASDSTKITIDPTNVKQQMVGFGGALTWYSNWVTANSKVNDIADLMFSDLGIDIIRFKNWYYPDNYPTDKTTTTMSADGSNAAWTATNTLYNLAMQRNPNIKILLSSWGPPASLKDNGKLPEGTLLRDNNGFMYDAFAQYWSDVLDHVPFNPDYISIQNEPTFTNPGWTTCQWSNVETSTLPDYNIAFNKVYDKIKTRTKVPIMAGPESANTQAFASFAPNLANNPNCGIYAYHPYDISGSTSASTIISSLQSVGNFSTKPNLMTEFSDNKFDWFNTALFIQSTLLYANTSGYIYWKLSWGPPSAGDEDVAMISMASANSTSAYTITPYFYLIKHFSKNIDYGYHRVDASSSNASLITTAFISPDNSKMTIVVVNNDSSQAKVYFNATGKTVNSMSATQSISGTYYQSVTITSPTKSILLPAKSITTVVLSI